MDLKYGPEVWTRLPIIEQSEHQRQITQILNRIPLYHFHLPQIQQSSSHYTVAFHNGQGCRNKLNHYSNDRTFYTQIDILCLAELYSPLYGQSIETFQKIIELPGQEKYGTGMAIFIKIV